MKQAINYFTNRKIKGTFNKIDLNLANRLLISICKDIKIHKK